MTTEKLKTQIELCINNESGHDLQFALNMVDGKPYLLIRKCLPKNEGKSWKEVEQLVRAGGQVRRECWLNTHMQYVFYNQGFYVRTVYDGGEIKNYPYIPASDKSDWIISKYPLSGKMSYWAAMNAVDAGRTVTNAAWLKGGYVKREDETIFVFNYGSKEIYHPSRQAKLSEEWRVIG